MKGRFQQKLAAQLIITLYAKRHNCLFLGSRFKDQVQSTYPEVLLLLLLLLVVLRPFQKTQLEAPEVTKQRLWIIIFQESQIWS